MFSRTMFGLSAFAVMIAASFWSAGPAVSGESRLQKEGNARYRPTQSISSEFGWKAMSGYFVQQGSVCSVILMVSEKTDLDQPSPSPLTATRVRLMLHPGQIAGLDSEDGRSLNFTCGADAATLVVDYGERSKLMAQRGVADSNTTADRVQEQR